MVATDEITVTQAFEPMSEAEILRQAPYRPSFLSFTLKVQDATIENAIGGLAVRITAQVTTASDRDQAAIDVDDQLHHVTEPLG